MALFDPGTLCPYCRQPMWDEDDLLGFTFVGAGPDDELLAEIDDAVVHQACLSRHPRRDEIVAAWNAEAASCIGPHHMLEVTRSGQVRYLSRWSRWRYRLARWLPRCGGVSRPRRGPRP